MREDFDVVRSANTIWMSRFGVRIFVHAMIVVRSILKKRTLRNSQSGVNAVAIQRWILRHLPWIRDGRSAGMLDEMTKEHIQETILMEC